MVFRSMISHFTFTLIRRFKQSIINIKFINGSINIKLKQIHPEGKVPAFVDADGKVVVDSTEIANYIDKKYPLPELYHEETKSRDLELLEHYSKVILRN